MTISNIKIINEYFYIFIFGGGKMGNNDLRHPIIIDIFKLFGVIHMLFFLIAGVSIFCIFNDIKTMFFREFNYIGLLTLIVIIGFFLHGLKCVIQYYIISTIANQLWYIRQQSQCNNIFDAIALDNIIKANEILKIGINVNQKNLFGNTPLIEAIKNENEDFVNLLLKNGADVNLENDKGNTPLKVAKVYTNDSIIKLLESTGAKEED